MRRPGARRALGAVLALALCCAAPGAAPGADYPARPIRLVVPYPPGASTNDILGRAIAARLTARLGQQVVVDNRSGASGTIGSELVAKATPDGYTLLVAVASPLAVGPSVYTKLGFDPVTDFAHVARIATIPYVMAVNLKVPARDIREFIALAKSRPGKVTFASSGTGGSPHLCSELFKVAAGVDMLHVPYKGAGIATVDVLSGQVQMFCTGLTALSAHIRAGRLRALGLASLKRSPLMPDLPTIAEQGLPGFEVNSWTGIVAPARTPAAVVKRLYGELAKITADPDFVAFLQGTGAEPALMGPDEFRAYIKSEIAKYAPVVKAIGIKPE
ncbi:MAG: tripartite tricarboxylate transporter substrate binding protein [Burkholderiales bacterium]|nr:tripartite tricarboxylate transporter substrate binding protein [Burkholderiales bacterium]